MALRILLNYQGTESIRTFDQDRVLIGRKDGAQSPDLDLSADPCVSRQHAAIQVKEGACWLSDLGSRFGTRVNERELAARSECRLGPEDKVLLGETTLRVALLIDKPAETPANVPAPPRPPVAALRPPTAAVALTTDVHIVEMIDTNQCLAPSQGGARPALEQRLAVLQALAPKLGEAASQNELLQTVMNHVIEALPAARRGALLLRDPQQDKLLLKAYISADEPAVSQTLVRRAIVEQRGFNWRSGQGDPTRSMRDHQMICGMCAPLQWRNQVLGVLCVDSPVATDTFGEDDLRFLIAVGLYAGLALVEQQSLHAIRRNASLLDRLMANFSPKLRPVLLEQARQGKLRPGGVKSEVTVLFCDLCGFTRQAAGMDAQDVVEMLNHYFQRLLETIFLYDGTVDKFVGDGVLAVFGSPEADAQQYQKAMRAAVALLQAMRATTQQRAARGDATCQVRIGVHCGEVFHGFIGAVDRLEFTVIGDAVNRACRYCQAAGEDEICISPDLYQHVFDLVKADKTSITTKEGELSAYRVKGSKE